MDGQIHKMNSLQNLVNGKILMVMDLVINIIDLNVILALQYLGRVVKILLDAQMQTEMAGLMMVTIFHSKIHSGRTVMVMAMAIMKMEIIPMLSKVTALSGMIAMMIFMEIIHMVPKEIGSLKILTAGRIPTEMGLLMRMMTSSTMPLNGTIQMVMDMGMN